MEFYEGKVLYSVAPLHICQGRPNKLFTIYSPLRQKLIHEGHESVVVMSFQHMHHLVDDYILNTLNRLLGKFQIYPYPTGSWVATAPLGLHLLDAPGTYPPFR